MTNRRRKPGIRAKIGFVLFGLIVALLMAEVAARILWPAVRSPGDVMTAYPTRPKPWPGGRGFFPPAGAVYTSTYDGDPYGTLPEGNVITYRINESGFRERPLPAGGLRGEGVVVLGDSFTFGEGVVAGVRFTEMCEKRLRAAYGIDLPVLNLAVTGYASEDEAEVAAAFVPELQPGIVLVAYCLNDAVHMYDQMYKGHFGFDLIMRRDGRLPPKEWEDSPSYLYRLIRNHFETRRLTDMTIAWYRDMYEGDDPPWLWSRQYLLLIRDIAAQSGAELGVVILPIFFRLNDDYPFGDAHRIVGDWCRAQGIKVLDLLPTFEGRATRELVVHPKDHHPNAAAHRAIGDAMGDFLYERFLRR